MCFLTYQSFQHSPPPPAFFNSTRSKKNYGKTRDITPKKQVSSHDEMLLLNEEPKDPPRESLNGKFVGFQILPRNEVFQKKT